MKITKTKIYSRDKKSVGFTTGGTRECRMESCNGYRMGVRWSDGKLTWPCSKGMDCYKRGLIIL